MILPGHSMTFREIRDGFAKDLQEAKQLSARAYGPVTLSPMAVAVAVMATLERLIEKEEAGK